MSPDLFCCGACRRGELRSFSEHIRCGPQENAPVGKGSCLDLSRPSSCMVYVLYGAADGCSSCFVGRALGSVPPERGSLPEKACVLPSLVGVCPGWCCGQMLLLFYRAGIEHGAAERGFVRRHHVSVPLCGHSGATRSEEPSRTHLRDFYVVIFVCSPGRSAISRRLPKGRPRRTALR